jgi:hypothetical protein
MNEKAVLKGIMNIMANMEEVEKIIDPEREKERQELRKLFHAQQPRLEDKVEQQMLLEQVINQYLDVKYDLRPALATLRGRNIPQYNRTYQLILKIEDSIGRTLGRLGITFSPQRYIPTAEQKNFDPKAIKELREKSTNLIDQIKDLSETAEKKEKKNGS